MLDTWVTISAEQNRFSRQNSAAFPIRDASSMSIAAVPLLAFATAKLHNPIIE